MSPGYKPKSKPQLQKRLAQRELSLPFLLQRALLLIRAPTRIHEPRKSSLKNGVLVNRDAIDLDGLLHLSQFLLNCFKGRHSFDNP